MVNKTKQLRRLVESPSIIVAPGCYDALGTRFIQRAGFSAAYMTGYGGLVNVQRTVREFQRAGVAGIHIEDQEEPKRCAAMGGVRVTEPNVEDTKIRDAVEGKQDPDFHVIARTDCRPALGVTATIERAHAFAEAGADMVCVEMLGSRAEVERVGREAGPVPVSFDMFDHPNVPVLTAAELERMGYSVDTFPFAATLGCARTLEEMYTFLDAEGGRRSAVNRADGTARLRGGHGRGRDLARGGTAAATAPDRGRQLKTPIEPELHSLVA